MKLNLGCGLRPLDGYVNVDKENKSKCDYAWNLEETPWPWPSASCDEIMASHVLEHLGLTPDAFCAIIVEIHRVLEPGGKLIVKTPHHRSDAFFGDPTHIRPVTPHLLSLFSKKHCQACIGKGWPNTPLAIYLDIDLELESTHYNVLPRWGDRMRSGNILKEEMDYAIETFNNVVDEVTMVLRKIE